ncbi:MAG: 3-hydroxyacyl-CoA dehydrogenase family protein [Deltaproteobacteria bacterium]|nr:3-hydroxyacyl-CoA dehydrogenase family protein [Deltaproteobacteria bacterium]
MSQIETVGIVGAGTMGTGIAEVTAMAGLPTVLVRATGGSPDEARRKIEDSLTRAMSKGRISAGDRDAALGRLTSTADRRALAACDLVVESVVEDLAVKRSLFAELHQIARPGAIFASNTSTLRIRDIGLGSPRGARTVGMHFFAPAPAMKLVELAVLDTTPAEVVGSSAEFVARIGKTAVPVVDSAGFVVNRLLVPYIVGAIDAYEQGLGKPESIDLAMKLGCGHPMGPLALADLIGLDVVFAMSKLLYSAHGDSRYKPPSLLRRLVQSGQLGRKSGVGIYDYATDPPRANEAARSEYTRGPGG